MSKTVSKNKCASCKFYSAVKLINATTFYCQHNKKYYPLVKGPEKACKVAKKGK